MDILTFSPSAISQIKMNIKNGETGNLALRIAARMTADETVQYGIGFDETKEDALIEGDGFKAVVSPDCIELLNGAHIDFVELEKDQHHFIFLNPNDPSYKPPSDEDSSD